MNIGVIFNKFNSDWTLKHMIAIKNKNMSHFLVTRHSFFEINNDDLKCLRLEIGHPIGITPLILTYFMIYVIKLNIVYKKFLSYLSYIIDISNILTIIFCILICGFIAYHTLSGFGFFYILPYVKVKYKITKMIFFFICILNIISELIGIFLFVRLVISCILNKKN